MSEQETKNKPDFIVYQVLDRDGKKDDIWNDIGAAWQHKDGNGFNIILNSLPLDGRLTMRKPKSKEL
ncbi:hypothetical protein Pse7367_3739 (plasmid) [Thalassoporum mexicanum PCC 7367]|uniref:hypothetical protein n=1 Tax=Thalassoporum mexicanum TaxID=3457544 RepID=UPI00029F9B6A|nr:hypothetical protein [Pseudanabaena sp. PCC 7367]AFY71965.1 hypothetical protein Pse7367_3739 [Pseudanabaena sp. PCC 7367]